MKYKILTERYLENARQLISSTVSSIENPRINKGEHIILLKRALSQLDEAIEKVNLESDAG
jgi:hypothetical protein